MSRTTRSPALPRFGLLASLALIAVIALAAPSRAQAPSDDEARRKQVIVKGDGVEVTLGQVEDTLAQQGPSLRARYKDPEALKGLVNNLVQAALLAAEAERRGYDKNAAVRHTVKESAAQALVRSEVEDKITPQSIPNTDIAAYYESHAGEFHRVGTRRGSAIVVDSAEEAARLLQEAKQADARGFAELAKQHSKDLETKAQGGDLGYFGREPLSDGSDAKVPAAVRKSAFELKVVGDTSPTPVALGSQRAIVRLTGERPERHISLDDASPAIRSKLWRERRQQALDGLLSGLRAREKPQVFSDRVTLVSFDDMEKRPAGFAPDPAGSPKLAPGAGSPAATRPVPAPSRAGSPAQPSQAGHP